MHPKRFECWRGEGQLESWCGTMKIDRKNGTQSERSGLDEKDGRPSLLGKRTASLGKQASVLRCFSRVARLVFFCHFFAS